MDQFTNKKSSCR